ncbi:MAG TPA: acetyl-CoA carboxylase biotin carboxyl carrier protein [Candidatus Paceibacterota bacterium]|nr:acetyl-CoA carboxylase biotin carboxyl carrier protein [Verrucomicrobiota bacterium]HOX01068.1 acetyl-CoA carboxylase biotin carboxyl carrier protein [Verrucomicrobiota bacterium]HRZ43828.1 acetyl-CoA carboxylase biotin carboxyl carrier protein [Candidatus Paceibacterota bacterium]
MDLKDIKAIIDLMRKNSISEFELEREGFKVRLKRGPSPQSAPVVLDEGGSFAYASPAIAAVQPGLPPASQAAAAVSTTKEIEIKAPMVGTFYRAPSPDAAPYIEVGNEVSAETVVCIIEAMKVMNEIKAEIHGVITQVLVENGKPVEYGQALYRVRPV